MKPWERYQQQTPQSGPWTKFQDIKDPTIKDYLTPSRSTPEAALSGLGQGLTFGHLAQAQAASEPITDAIFGLFSDKQAEPLRPYVERRDANIRKIEQYGKENPLAYGGGYLGGAIATTPVAGAAIPIKGAGLLGRGTQAIAGGAALGLLQNPGDTEGQVDPIQKEERIQGAKTGAAIGILGQGAMEGLRGGRYLVGKGAKALKGAAERRAFKSLGPTKRFVEKNKPRLQELGREVLDQDLLKGVPSYETIADRSVEALEKEGKQIGNVIDDIASFAEGKSVPEAKMLATESQLASKSIGKIDRSTIAKSLRDDLISSTEIPGTAAENESFQSLINEFESKAPLGIKDAQGLKIALSKKIKWDRLPGSDIPLKEQFYRSLYSKLSSGIEDAAEMTASTMGSDTLNKLRQAKQKYGNLKEIEKIASKKGISEFANRIISPSDYMAGIGGLASGGGVKAMVVGALGNKAARITGNAQAAKALDKLANFLDKNPMLFNKYSDAILRAAEKNPKEFSIFVNRMIQNSDFKEENK